jgi:hypothetical protein
MPTASAKSESERLPPWLKQAARKIAPWYAGVMSVYAPGRVLYGWSQRAAGALRVPIPDLIFNVLTGVGATTALAALGGLFAGLTVYHAIYGCVMLVSNGPRTEAGRERLERIRNRAGLAVGVPVSAVLIVWMFVSLIHDPKGNDFAMAAEWGDPWGWVCAFIGAAVLAIAYGLFGRKLLRWVKALKAELERPT